MTKNLAIIEYGVGNISSVTKAFKYIGLNAEITSDPKKIELSDAVILPGVGAFPDAAERLKISGMDTLLIRQAKVKPVMGICLGMQLLFSVSEEFRVSEGLALVPGRIRKIETKLKLPHIGWNSLNIKKDDAITKGLNSESYVYFVHSFCAEAENPEDILAVTEYGGAEIAAVIKRGNVFGCQFHPEKSGETGLMILKNFGEL